MTKKLSEIQIQFISSLGALYDEREIRAIFHQYINDRLNISKYKYYLSPEHELPDDLTILIENDIERLAKGEPLQYICGKTLFYGLKLDVNSSVLIPRPETEELTDLIIKENKNKNITILDIGTGSGAIAISLAKHLSEARVSAIDISPEALSTAKANALKNAVFVDFKVFDIMNGMVDSSSGNFDIIVSNPPYIPESEKKHIHPNVVEYEPEIALFVPDSNPLVFYKEIAMFSKNHLKKGGIIYLETHEKFHNELEILFSESNFINIRKLTDINGKPRILVCRKE
jgi:release factor glutamine methyltransferase